MEFGFLIKKFITFFVEPFGMVFSLFIIGLYFLFFKSEKLSKIFLSFSFGLLFLFSYPPFSNYLISSLENENLKYKYDRDIRYIHVLGGGYNTDKAQPISSQIGEASVKRVLEGIIIHFNTPNSQLIFTGYKGDSDVAGAVMNARLATALGVEKEDMIINPEPKDTEEEALYLNSILDDNEPFILVTSATHMKRSMMLFKSLGLNPIPAPTNFYKQESEPLLSKPDVTSFKNSTIAMHEYIGILWNKIRAITTSRYNDKRENEEGLQLCR